MAHTYSSILMHIIFSTKNRSPMITPELEERLWPYMGGIARSNKMAALAVGGTDDHMHLLLSLPTTLSVAKALQLIKGGSSKWIHDTLPEYSQFEWQEGYGAFSVSVSQKENTVKYINHQKQHHQKKAFQQEYVEFLKKHHIDYDERYIWG